MSEASDVPSTNAGVANVSEEKKASGSAEPMFPDLKADDDIDRITVIESLCTQCYKEGTTRMLLTRIPFFRDVVVSSFSCDHCNWRNTEVQQCSDVAAKAARYELRILGPEDKEATRKDLNRQMIKSEHATVFVKEVEFEIPAKLGPGQINTVEGIVRESAEILQMGQEHRKSIDPEVTAKIQVVIDRLIRMADGDEAMTVVLDDPSGTSYLENPYSPGPDHRVIVSFYERSAEQNRALGIAQTSDEAVPATASFTYTEKLKGFHVSHDMEAKVENLLNVEERGAVFPGLCPECRMDAETRMCTTDIPHFKDIVLMVTQCEHCGYKDREVKPGGSVSAKGRKVTLRVRGLQDFKRDILKSDSASVAIPELDLELQEGTLGGKYTTLEGLLNDIKEQLERMYACATGDSSLPEQKHKIGEFMGRFEQLLDGKTPFTLVIDDALGNSFVGSLTADGEDPQITNADYDRSWEQNEELGLNDIDVDEESYVRKHAEALALEERQAAEAREETGTDGGAEARATEEQSAASSASTAAEEKEKPASTEQQSS